MNRLAFAIGMIAAVTLAALISLEPARAASNRIALVLGHGAYQSVPPLPNPSNDAADVAQALRNIGFDVIEGRDLERRAMEEKIREFGRRLDNADVALFFYAGHGLQVGGKNYLVPVDAKLERAGDLSFETLDVGLVLGQMEADKRVNLVFLDACRDNPLSRSLARALGARSAAVGQGLASIQSAVGTMIAYATQPDNVALDGDGRNSPFTTALLKHIATPGLEISSVMKRVRADVVAATRDRQIPWDHSSLIGDVVLVPTADGVTAVRPEAVRPAAVSPPAAAPAVPAPALPLRAAAPLPALTRDVLRQEPAIGKLPPGASVLVDDGTCPAGQIKQVVGGNIVTGQPRLRSCVSRN
jgi:uncharacterized caspase-like protein